MSSKNQGISPWKPTFLPLTSNGNLPTQPCEGVFRGLAGREDDCRDAQRQRYYAKISGPLLDRIDIQVDVSEVKFKDIVSRAEGESSECIRERVGRARERQLLRFKARKIYANVQMGTREIKKSYPVF